MLEYLILNNKLESAKHFNKTETKSISDKLMFYFHEGMREEFMDLFALIRKQSKLEFYLTIYFLVYNIHPALKGRGVIPEAEKVAFKDYLDNKGAELAKTNQFLQFYALPFIKKPLQHEAFKNLFKKQWVRNLKEKLQRYLSEQEKRWRQASKSLTGPSSGPIAEDSKASTQKIREMEKINKKLFEEVKAFTQKYQVLQDSHKSMVDGFNAHMLESQSKWFQITKQLVNCSKNLIHMLISSESAYLTDRKFIKIKKRTEKYDKFVNRRFDDLVSQSQDISIFDKPSINELSYSMVPYTQKNFTGLMGVEDYLPTDYIAMKAHFKRSQNSEKESILNGLYWRIVRSKDKNVRRMNIIGMFKQDFLGLHSGDLDQLLASRQLMKPTLRLLQMVSLDSYGRKILFVNNHLHRDFVGLIDHCQDHDSLEYIMYTLGQISSSKKFKLDLISLGIVEICMQILRKGAYLKNEIILENIAAILLNMLEKEEAFVKFEGEPDLFDVLKRYTQIPFKITRALIYGVIYALLENQELFYRAHEQNLDQFLTKVLKSDPTVNKKQLTILREKLHNFQPKQIAYDASENSDEDNDSNEEQQFDFDEEEVHEIEEIMKCHDDIVHRFALKGNEARKQLKQVKEAFEELKANRVPHFANPQKGQLPKITSPKNVGSSRLPETPYIRSPAPVEMPLAKKKDNFLAGQQKKSNIRIKERNPLERPQTRQQEEKGNQQNQKMRKSKSAEKHMGYSREKDNRSIYESNRLPEPNQNKVTEFKAIDEKNYRSPQVRKSREEVLKQLNEQLKAEQKILKEKKRVSTADPRQNQLSSYLRGQNEPNEAFEPRPKLRRTPPHE